MITISSASSHQNSSVWLSNPSVAPQLARNATVIASPISSIIPGRRARSSLTAPLRNGEPPHAYMTEPSSGGTHASAPSVGTS